MRASSASLLALAAVALSLAGTLVASAETSHGVAPAGVVVALNPQPLPPIVDDHDFDDDYFHG